MTVVLERKPYEPFVTQEDDGLVYHLPVESGFSSKRFKFSISEEDVAVLKTDNARFYFLFAVLHQKYQMQNPALEPGTDPYFGSILRLPPADVTAILDAADAESKGAVRHMACKLLGRNSDEMGQGRWFEAT